MVDYDRRSRGMDGKRIDWEEGGNRAEVLSAEFAMENTRRHPLHHFARKFNGIRGREEDYSLDAKKELLSLGSKINEEEED